MSTTKDTAITVIANIEGDMIYIGEAPDKKSAEKLAESNFKKLTDDYKLEQIIFDLTSNFGSLKNVKIEEYKLSIFKKGKPNV